MESPGDGELAGYGDCAWVGEDALGVGFVAREEGGLGESV